MMRTLDKLCGGLAGGRLQGEGSRLPQVCTDTRTLAPASSSWRCAAALNGNEFVAQAHAAGAAVAVVDTPQVTPLAQVIVAESEAALARAAQQWRGRFDIPVIASPASNGKDQHQRDDRRRSWPAPGPDCHARQSQQSHRRAADPSAPGSRASLRRH